MAEHFILKRCPIARTHPCCLQKRRLLTKLRETDAAYLSNCPTDASRHELLSRRCFPIAASSHALRYEGCNTKLQSKLWTYFNTVHAVSAKRGRDACKQESADGMFTSSSEQRQSARACHIAEEYCADECTLPEHHLDQTHLDAVSSAPRYAQ